MDVDAATLVSAQTDATLVPQSAQSSRPAQEEENGMEGFIRFDFSSDNPSNTTISDSVGSKLYDVKTTYQPKTVTSLRKITNREDGSLEEGEELFRLEWRDILSDKISVRRAPPIDFTSLLSPTHVLLRSRKFSFDGKVYRWTNLSGAEGPQLLAEGSQNPIARFRSARKPLPPAIQARLVNPLPARPACIFAAPEAISTPGLLDMIFITFLPMEKSRRIRATSSRNTMGGASGVW